MSTGTIRICFAELSSRKLVVVCFHVVGDVDAEGIKMSRFDTSTYLNKCMSVVYILQLLVNHGNLF